MIPIIFVLGIVIGRWWVVPAAGIVWVILLVAMNHLGLSEVPIAAALAIANAAIGVAGHKVVALSLRYVRKQPF